MVRPRSVPEFLSSLRLSVSFTHQSSVRRPFESIDMLSRLDSRLLSSELMQFALQRQHIQTPANSSPTWVLQFIPFNS